MAHHERSPAAPNIALVYTLYLPLVVAGFGLGSSAPHLFPDGLVVFAMKAALGDQAEVWDIFRGTFPFEIIMGGLIVFLLMFPKLSTWLPSLM